MFCLKTEPISDAQTLQNELIIALAGDNTVRVDELARDIASLNVITGINPDAVINNVEVEIRQLVRRVQFISHQNVDINNRISQLKTALQLQQYIQEYRVYLHTAVKAVLGVTTAEDDSKIDLYQRLLQQAA